MKKTVFLLVLVALLCCGMASASGIGGLIPAASTGPVPDPAQITESYGELLAENYEFSVGYFCDAYVYETPDDVRDFADMYATRCRKAGYSMTAATIDGAAGYTIQSGNGLYACLIPDANGQMLLLIQRGMAFVPETRTNYASMIYNNRSYDLELFQAKNYDFFNTWDISYQCDRGVFQFVRIYVPRYARTGDRFYVSGSDHIEGFALSLDWEDELLGAAPPYYGGYRTDGIDSARDYAELVVTKVEDVEYGVLVEGLFNGRFKSGDVVIENFIFSAIVEE